MSDPSFDPQLLAERIKREAASLGFSACGITGTRLDEDEAHLLRWIDDGFHGEMDYMHRHGPKRSRPQELVAGTISVVSVRMDYLSADAADMQATLDDPALAYVSRYALGRDYHKLMRSRLQQLADRIETLAGPFGYRAFVDSAPVLEKALARNSGLGWIGKNANLIDKKHGSWFFLGELYTDLPLTRDPPEEGYYCGTCTRCIDTCPTGAIVAPNRIDARRCISYLTIELHGPIPEDLRPLIGNRIYGCDDCQLVCPWNKFARPTTERDFAPRHALDRLPLTDVFAWSEAEFLARTEGSPIRRIGHERWLRNIAVALGNAPKSAAIIAALQSQRTHPSELVREHVLWALARHGLT
jgi:epoxyqueuosine reductase